MARIKKKKYEPGKLKRNLELTSQEIKLIHRILTERKDETESLVESFRFSLNKGKIVGTRITLKKMNKLLKKMENYTNE